MRSLGRAVAIAVVILGTVPVLSGTSWACSCTSPAADQVRYREVARTASVVYVGRVVGETHAGGDYRYDVDVEEKLKGTPSEPDTVVAADNEAACGTRLHDGPVLVVDGAASLCGPTTQERVAARAAVVRAALGQPSPMPSPVPLTEEDRGAGPVLPVALAGAGIVALAVLTLRTPRPRQSPVPPAGSHRH